MNPPSPEQIKAARQRAGHTQTQAAETVHWSLRSWQSRESGDREMPLAEWELYRIKTGQIKVPP